MSYLNLLTKFCVIGTLFLSVACHAFNKEVITWRVIDWPPFYILHGQDKGQGVYDILIDKMITAMPEYQHKKVVMNTQRVLMELTKGHHVCHPSALADTPAALSYSNSFLLPQRLIYNTLDQPLWLNQNEISLISLLNDQTFNLGLATNRYPKVLNALIDFNKQKNQLTLQNNYNSLIRMFFRRRINGIIEYPPVITYSQKLFDVNVKTRGLVIKELNNADYFDVHFACPDNEWGKAVIAKINQQLILETKQENYLSFRLKWYDEESRTLLKSYYQKHYLTDKKKVQH